MTTPPRIPGKREVNRQRRAIDKALADARAAELPKILQSLHFTDPVVEDIPVPSGSSDTTRGWLFNAYREHDQVQRSCSSTTSHSFGRDDKTNAQQPRALFSTRLLALRALRNAVELEAATRLRGIDKMIEQEEKA